MKTARRENPNRYTTVPVAYRVFGTEAENTSCSIDRLDVKKKSGPRSPWWNHDFLSDEICIGDSGDFDDG
jgi:hypothetical protein